MEAIKTNGLEEEVKTSEEVETDKSDMITVEEPKKSRKGWIIAGLVGGIAAIVGGALVISNRNNKSENDYYSDFDDDVNDSVGSDDSEGSYDKFVEDAANSEESEN